jgi:hypothetical protein
MCKPMLEEQFKMAAAQYENELRQFCPQILTELPISFCISLNNNPTPMRHYINLSSKLTKCFDAAEQHFGAEALTLFLKYLLCSSVVDAIDKLPLQISEQNLSKNHQELYLEWFERMHKDLSQQSGDYYHHRNGDGYRQDIAVAGLRVIPIGGAWLVELIYHNPSELKHKPVISDWQNIPELDDTGAKQKDSLWRLIARLVFPGMAKNFIKYYLKNLAIMLAQYDMYVVIHTASREQHKFTPKQMARGYQYIAELLNLRKELKGVYRASWFLDPALKNISPRLAFLWELPCSHGAKLIYIGLNNEDKPFLNAPARQDAYDRGEYTPRTFAYHWDRQDLITWDQNQ